MIEPLPGRWIGARSLAEVLYRQFTEHIGWPEHSWKTVGIQFRQLPGVRRRQKDRRRGPDRRGSSPVEYLIPHPGK